jgi:hypothetical protein
MARPTLGLMLAALLLGGCGDGVPGAVARVDGDKPIGSLTPAEAMQVCGEIQPATTAATCDFVGLLVASYVAANNAATDTELRLACSAAAAECQQQSNLGCELDGPGSSCTATVDELLTCVDAAVALIPSCTRVTRNSLKDLASAMNPVSCLPLEAKCPALIPGAAFGSLTSR